MKEITVIHVMSDDTKAFLRELLNEFKNDSKNASDDNNPGSLAASPELPLFGKEIGSKKRTRNTQYFQWRKGSSRVEQIRSGIDRCGHNVPDSLRKNLSDNKLFTKWIRENLGISTISVIECGNRTRSHIAAADIIKLNSLYQFIMIKN